MFLCCLPLFFVLRTSDRSAPMPPFTTSISWPTLRSDPAKKKQTKRGRRCGWGGEIGAWGSYIIIVYLATFIVPPLKFNMEPENQPLEKEIPFGNHDERI